MLSTSLTIGPLGGCSVGPDELEFTHIVAGAVQIVAAVNGDVQRTHLGPAVRRARLGEVTWRSGGGGTEVRAPACFHRVNIRYSRAVSSLRSIPPGRTGETRGFAAHSSLTPTPRGV